jgi:2-methylisocitrate lyase-like PEP mutase family enzyme
MTRDEQQRKAEEFLALHTAPELLVLANAWDVCSARLFEFEGFKAVGTTSAGVAATLGYPDGQRISLAEAVEVVRRIVAQVRVPVSADIEAGYSESVEGVVGSAKAVLEVGAVGINLEDSTGDPARPLYDVAQQTEKLAAIREMSDSAGVHLVINARTDGYLLPSDDPARRFHDTVERANAYRRAGADCIFVPDMGDLDKDTMASLVKEIDAPVNVIAGATTPPLEELEAIGIARVSFGPRPMRAALALVRKIARELRDTGTYAAMTAETLSYAEINEMFADRSG